MFEESKGVAVEIGKIIDNKKGQDIKILDIKKISNFADYFVIASGTSTRQVKAIADEIKQQMELKGVLLDHKEGYDNGRWILLDYSDVIVHLFIEEERSFYSIERVWKDASHVNIDNI